METNDSRLPKQPPYLAPLGMPEEIWLIIWNLHEGTYTMEEQIEMKNKVWAWCRTGPLRDAQGSNYLDIHAKIAVRIVGNWDDAEDVVSKTYSDCFTKYFHTFNPYEYSGKRCPLRTWLTKAVTRNACIHPKRPNNDKNRRDDLPPDDPSHQRAVSKERTDDLELLTEEILTRLSQEDRRIIEMRNFEGRTFKEIGEELGISEEAAKVRHHRVLKKARKLVNPENRTPYTPEEGGDRSYA